MADSARSGGRLVKAFEADMREYIKGVLTKESGHYACYLCKRWEDPYTGKRYTTRKLECPEGCNGCEHWIWRGPCKENGGADNA